MEEITKTIGQFAEGWESCCRAVYCFQISVLETLHSCSNLVVCMLFQEHCALRDKPRPRSCVFSIAFVLSDPVSPWSLHSACLSLPVPPLHVFAYKPVTGMEKPQIVLSEWCKDLMNFCVVLWLKGDFIRWWVSYGTWEPPHKAENLSFPWHNGCDCHIIVIMMRAAMSFFVSSVPLQHYNENIYRCCCLAAEHAFFFKEISPIQSKSFDLRITYLYVFYI